MKITIRTLLLRFTILAVCLIQKPVLAQTTDFNPVVTPGTVTLLPTDYLSIHICTTSDVDFSFVDAFGDLTGEFVTSLEEFYARGYFNPDIR